MSDLTFVHLSDLHFAGPGQEPWLGMDAAVQLGRVLDAIEAAGVEPACFVVSGDLVNGPQAANYEALRSGLRTLQRFGVPVVLGLGNHDDRPLFRQLILGAAEGGPEQPCFHSLVVEDLRLIVLDSKGGTGGEIGIGEEQLQFVADQLREPASRGSLLIIHHPPLPTGVPELRARLGGRRRLAQVIAGSAVRGILCGHVHFSNVGLFAGAICATAPAVISLLDPSVQDGVRQTDGGGFNLVQLRDGELIIHPVVLAGEQRELRYDRR